MLRRVHFHAPEEMSVVMQSQISKGRCASATLVPVFQPSVVDYGIIPVVLLVKNIVDMLTVAVQHCVLETPVYVLTVGVFRQKHVCLLRIAGRTSRSRLFLER